MAFLTRLILVAVMVHSSTAIIAYNCDDQRVDRVTVSLVQTPECSKFNKNITSQEVNVVVTQPISLSYVNAKTCLVVIDHLIYRCGKSIDTFHNAGFYSEVIQLTRDQCVNMITTKTYIMKHFNWVQASLQDGLNLFSATTYGKIREGGSCESGDSGLNINGEFYDRPVRLSKFSVTIATRNITLYPDEDKVRMVDGVTCKYSDGHCFHPDHGNVFWDQNIPTCADTPDHAVIYAGKAIKTLEREGSQVVTSYQVSSGDHEFLLTTIEKTMSLCGYDTFFTEHPRIFVTEVAKLSGFPMKKKANSHDIDIVAYINSKLVYVMK